MKISDTTSIQVTLQITHSKLSQQNKRKLQRPMTRFIDEFIKNGFEQTMDMDGTIDEFELLNNMDIFDIELKNNS